MESSHEDTRQKLFHHFIFSSSFFPPSLVSDLPDVLFFFFFTFFSPCSLCFRHYLRTRNPAVWPHFDKSKGSYLNEHICQWVLSTTYYYYPLCVCVCWKRMKKIISCVGRPPSYIPPIHLPAYLVVYVEFGCLSSKFYIFLFLLLGGRNIYNLTYT